MNTSKYIVTKLDYDRILMPKGGLYNSVLVWMHGLGDSAEGYVDFFNGPSSPTPNSMKIILLTAQAEPVTVNGGMIMNSWYDILNFNDTNNVDEANVSKNSQRVVDIIIKEAKSDFIKNDYKKIFIGGFSQGACMSLYIGNTLNQNFAGILSCSGYLFPFIKNINLSVPIFAYHGKADPIIPYAKTVKSYERLKENKNFYFNGENDLEHTFSYKELQEMEKFFNNYKI